MQLERPTTQLAFSFYDLLQLEQHIIKSHMFVAVTPEGLAESIKNCRFLSMVRSEKASLRLREIDMMLDFPNNKLRKQALSLFRQVEERDEKAFFVNEYLFKQNLFLDKFRSIARNELAEDTEKFYKQMGNELKQLGIKK